MKIGYARVSTAEQEAGMLAQIRDLEARGCDRILQERVSSVKAVRPELENALKFLQVGDEFIVTKLDRLARSTRNLLSIVDRIAKAGAALIILDMGIDTGTPAGQMVLTVMAAIAQFEREIMLLRQREGINHARKNGVYSNHITNFFKNKQGLLPNAGTPRGVYVRRVIQLKEEGMSHTKIAAQLGCSRRTIVRIAGDLKKTMAQAADEPQEVENAG